MQDATFGYEYYRELNALRERFAKENPGEHLDDPRNVGYKKQMIRDAGIRVRRSVYQDTLADLLESGVPGITRREKPEFDLVTQQQPLFADDKQRLMYAGSVAGAPLPDDDTFGDLVADPNSDAHEFAVLRQNQYEAGRPLRYWDEYLATKPSKLQAGVQGLIINATMGFEGSAQGIAEWVGTAMADIADPQYKYAQGLGVTADQLDLAIARVEKKPPTGLAKFDYARSAEPTEQDRRIYESYMKLRGPVVEGIREDFGNMGRRWARNVTDVILPQSVSNVRNRLVGSNPEEPIDIREDIGRGGGGAFVKTMEMTGSALGVMPYSVPAMATRNPRLAAALTSPFFAMGHSEAWNRRMRIYEQQAAEAEAAGMPAPPRPTFGELKQQANWGGLIEFGSEFTIDRLQVALPGIANRLSRRLPNVAGQGAESISKSADALLDSLSRRRGPIGVAKGAAVVAAGGATESIEEAIPELGKEVTDLFYIPEGYENDFFSAQTAENMGTGFIAGTLFGGAQQAFGREARMRRAEQRKFKKAAEGATSTVVGAITDKASRILQQRFAANAVVAKGASMAAHQVAEIAANKRMAMFVNPEMADVTLTDDVREQMAQNGITDKPIGRINGMDVYAQVGMVDDVASYIEKGDIAGLTGYPELMQPGMSMAGAIVVRNKARQIVDAIPFSDSKAAEDARPAVEHTAALSGSTVEVVNADGLASLSEALELQVDADATMRKMTPPSKRGLLPQAKARGIEALRIDMSEDALGTKAAGNADEQFSSPLLTMAEIGNATNKDVEVVTEVSEVPQSQLTEAERNIGKATGANPVILDAKVTYKITRPDGKVDVYERSTINNGGYLGEVSPDGLFLIRDNGTAFTRRNAIMLALHEMRHALVGKNRGAAAYLAKLLYLDPAFAMRGGIEYMREYENIQSLKTGKPGALTGIDDDAAAIVHYQASHAAALAVLQDEAGYARALKTQNDPNATAQERYVAETRIEQQAQAQSDLREVERFAEESLANVPNRAIGQVGSRALEWEGVLKDSNERSMRKFVAWFSHVLARNGYAGPEARQALYELQQRIKGVDDHRLKVQQQMAAEIEKKYRDDLMKHAEMKAQVAPQVPQQAAQPAQPQQAAAPQPGQPGYVGPMQQANVAVRPVQPVSQPGAQQMPGSEQPTSLRPNPPQSQEPPAYSLRPRAGAQEAGIALPGGDRDEQIMAASQRLAEISALPDDQKPAALASVVGLIANVLPLLTQTQASLGSTGRGAAAGGVRTPTIPPPSAAVEEQESAAPTPAPMGEAERQVVERQRAEPMLSLRNPNPRVEELVQSSEFLDTRGFGPHTHPKDSTEDIDEMAAVEAIGATEVPPKYTRSNEEFDYLLGAVESLGIAKSNTVQEYYEFLDKIGNALSTGLASTDDVVVAAKRNGYQGFRGDLAIEQEQTVTRNDIEKVVDVNFSLRNPIDDATEARLASMLQGVPFRVFEGDPRFDLANSEIDGVSKARFTEVTQQNLKSIAQADSVFHETSSVNARKMIPEFNRGFKRMSPIDVSTNRDIAIGQGGSGVRIEFDASRVNGNYGARKPGQTFLDARGIGEFTVDAAIRGAVSAIEVKSPAVANVIRKNPVIERMFDWSNPEQTGYGTRYRSMFSLRKRKNDPDGGIGRTLSAKAITALNPSEQELQSTVLDLMLGGSKDKTFIKQDIGGITKIVRHLSERRRASGLRKLDIESAEDQSTIARLMALEAVAHIEAARDALEWYDSTIRSTMAQASLLYPELASDKNAQMIFAIGLAVTSQGMNVEANIGIALNLYERYRESIDPATGIGSFPSGMGQGKMKKSQEKNLALANKILSELGVDGMRDFLAKQFTVKQLREIGYKPGGELIDEVLLGSSVFGPKIGFGFLSNLTGNFDPVTMDMWLMRTVLRLAGILSKFKKETYEKQVARFLAGARVKRPSRPRGIYAEDIDADLVRKALAPNASASSIRAFARAVVKAHEKDYQVNRKKYDAKTRQQTEMVRAAKTIVGSIDKPRDSPKSGGERRNLRNIVRQAVAMTNEITGLDVTNAAFQALIWYPEQELYRAMGAKLKVTSQDYSGAMTKELLKRGVDDARIRAAIAGARAPRGGPGGGGGRGRGKRSGDGAGARQMVARSDGQANGRTSQANRTGDGSVDAMFSIRRGLPGVRDEAMLRYIDKFDELLRYQREAEARGINIPPILNPYIGARLLSGRLGAMQQEAERDYADLLRRMHLDGVTLAEMDEFLTAQHAEERNIYVASINPAFPDGGSGMFTGDARNIIQAAVNSGRFGMLNGYAEEWRQMLRDALNERLANGLINRQTYDNLTARYQNYVPLRGAPVQPNDEDFLDFGEAGGRGLSTTGRGLPASMGRRSEAEAVTSQVGYVHEDTFRRIERNRIGQSFLHLVQAVNDPNMAEVVRPTRRAIVPTYAVAPGGGRVRTGEEVRVIHDPAWMTDQRHFGLYTDRALTINGHNYEPGDLIVIRINNRRLADAMTSPSLELRSFERGLRHVNNAWRFMTTGLGNPAFPIANMFRDVLTGAINNYAARGAADTLGMMRRWSGAFRNVFVDSWNGGAPTGAYGDFVRSGGDQLYWRPNDLEVKRADFDAIAERVARRDPNDRTLARTLFGWYPAFFEAAEKATRVAQYEQRIATGASEAEAALAARDLTIDFAKGGQAKPVLNTWYMFLNAGLQGNVNLLRSIQSAPGTVPALIGLGFANAALARFMGGDDEETNQANVDNIPEYERTSNMYFFDPRGTGKYVKVPLPYGYNVFFSMGARMADAVYGRKTSSDVLNGTLVDALNAFNPMGGSGIKSGGTALVAAAVPTMARPAIELLGNEDFAGRPIAPTVFDRFPGPRSQNAFDGTPEGYKRFAETVNSMTGGDEFEAGMIDASPNHIQYLLGYYFSGTGRLLDRVYKAALSNEEVTANDLPVMRSFVGDARNDTRALSQNFYGLLEEIAPARRRLDFAMDEANPLAERQRVAREISEGEVANADWMKLYEKELTKLRKQLKTATPEQRDAIMEVRRKVLKAAVAKKNELTDIGLGVD